MFFPNNTSDQSISVFFNGRMCSVPESDPNFAALREHLALPEHDYEFMESMIDKPKMIERLSEGLVSVIGSTVYYKGEPVHSTLSYRLLDVLNAGENAMIWARFLERVMSNPSERARECLYEFLNHWKAPITEDGHFIAFKRVRPNYRDMHSNSFDNSPGQMVEMDREGVNPDPHTTCSSGLHVAATSYLGHFMTHTDSRTVACKVDPMDVVSVPIDYGFAKMRVCRYLVLGDAEETFYNNAEEAPVSRFDTARGDGATATSSGVPICHNAVDFMANWKRTEDAPIEVGDTVAPSASSNNDELPTNRFLTGVVAFLDRFEIGEDSTDDKEKLDRLNVDYEDGDVITLAVVEWQDGGESDDLVIVENDALNSDIVYVRFIGELVEPEEEYDEYEAYCDDCGADIEHWLSLCSDCEDHRAEAEEEDEDFYCGNCGNEPVTYEDDYCFSCEEEEERAHQEEWDRTCEDVDEAEHIMLEGLTTDGEVPTPAQVELAKSFFPHTSEQGYEVPKPTPGYLASWVSRFKKN